MSRAFVREMDGPQLPEIPPLVSPLPPGARNYLTAGGAQRLQAELARLLEQERPRLAAGAHADLEAKHAVQVIDQRILYLQESLRTAEIVAATAGPAEIVRFGATVTVRETGGAETRYRIVGVDETDPARNWVSWLSPLARALLNRPRGGRVVLQAPRGTRELEILRIEFEP